LIKERQEAEGRRQKGEKVQTLPLMGKKGKNILCQMHSTRKDASLSKPLSFMGEVYLLPPASCLAAWRL
jgi:hypothetical protein